MDQAKGAKEMSFRRPHHAVELVEEALGDEGTSVICVTKEESKLFIAFQLFQVALSRFKKAGIMVLLVDDESAGIVKPFLRATSNQGLLSVKTCFDDKDFMKEGHHLVPSFDVMVTKGRLFLEVLRAGLMDLMSFTLIVFDDCHLVRDADHPFAILVKHVEECMLNLKPKIVGVSSEIQHHLTSPLDLESFLHTLAELFHCTPSISSDLLALNRYGEQVEEEIVHYTCLLGNDQFTCELVEIIQKALLFLKDIPLDKSLQECVVFVKHIFTECYKVLSMIGPLQTAYVANIALAEIKKLERRSCEEYDLLTLQFCRTQMSFILKLSEQYKLEGCKLHLTDMTTKLLLHMSTHLMAEFNEESSSDLSTRSQENLVSDVNSSSTKQLEHNAEISLMCSSSQQLPMLQPVAVAASQQSQTECTGTFQSSSLQSTYGVKTQCDDPLCIVLVPSVIIAKALNFLINQLSNSMPEYSFLKSAFVRGSKSKQGTLEQGFSDETGDNVMECVQDGSINILFATFEVERELYVRRCSLLMRLGMPKHYTHFLNVKKRVKSAGAKVVFLVREEEKLKTEQNYKVLQRMKNVLLVRCSNSGRPPSHNIKKLFLEDQGEAYEPFGENGPKVDLLSSISLVNSYCAKFPSSGVGVPVPVCRMEELWADDHVEFVSTMYLPRNSPIYWPIKASAKVSRDEVNKETLKKAMVKSEMLVAMETCRQLHEAEELSEDLQPMYRLKVFSLTSEDKKCDCEVADSGTGVDGSLKRNRAYTRKFPSILKDNVPVCGGPSFLYSITLELTKPWTFEMAVRSQSKAHSSGACLCLGFLSRKPLPKLPGMLIFDRAGEVTATVTECRSNPVFLSSDHLSLIQRFTEYVFKDIAKAGKSFKEVFPKFDPTVATAGYYVVVVKNLQDRSSSSLNAPDCKEIAFDFMHSIENAIGSFDNPTDPPPPGIQDMEAFTDAVVTAIYNDKCLRYYVAEICYDRSPADPFPNSEAAATFAEYYQRRYGIEVTLDQPMLDVDHVTSRLNFLLPRYQNIKGHHLSVRGKDSKRSQKSKVFVVPELCSIHPIPGYLWRQLFVLPAVLYRIESLLVAEELRSSVARALRMGAVQWPNDVPLPQLTTGDMVGEEIMSPSNSLSKDSKGKATPEMGRHRPITLLSKTLAGEDVLQAVSNAEDLRDKRLGNDIDKPVTFHFTESEDEEIVGEKDSEAVKSGYELDLDMEDTKALLHTELCQQLVSMQISQEENLDLVAVAGNCPSRSKCYNSGSSSLNRFDSLSKDEASTLLSSSECKYSEAKLGFSESGGANATTEHGSSCQVDHNKPSGEVNNDKRLTVIWTDPFLSRLYQASGPPSTLILRALTTCSAGDVFSLERLEMLGDSFVKYAVSTSVFFQHLHENEGKLSFIRGLRVSNRQLFYLARQRGLPSYMFTGMFNPLVNWLPPGFYYENSNDVERATDDQLLLMPDKSSEELEEDDEDVGIFVQEELSGQSHKCGGSSSEVDSDTIPLDPYLHHCCSDKAVADMTEALVGVYLLCFGPEGAWRFLEWLGMELTKGDETKDGASEEAVIAEDSALAVATGGLDVVMSSEDFSKAPCSVQETSDQSLSQLKTSDFLATVMQGSKSISSSKSMITNLEEALNCRCKDMSETTCQKFDETLPETVPDLLPTRRDLLSSAATQTTLNFPPSSQSVPDCLINLPQKATDALSCDSALLSSDTTFVGKFDAVEEALSYRFNNHSLLQQAFTHTSLPRDYNSVRCSYEQLEFLGDALLDFLVTHHLYMYHRHMSPGDLTDLRSAVVNNFSFAALSVKLGFAKHLQSLSPPLFSIVNRFVEKLKEKEMKQHQADHNEIYSSVFVLESEDSEGCIEVEVPKVLGDLFEAVAGALYVDCGQDINTVWRVYLPILKPSIDYYSAHPPLSAVRKLLEMMPNAAKFAPIERMVDGKFKSTLTVSSHGTFVGIGRNFRIAKSTAAQRALTALQKRSSPKKLEKT